MKDIKMSEVFNGQLPLSDELVCKRLSPSWQMRDYSKYVAHAINSHDSLVEQLAAAKAEIAEYRELLGQIVDMGAMSPYQLGIIDRLLAKHKGSDEK